MCGMYGVSVRACGRADELVYMRAQVRVGIRIIYYIILYSMRAVCCVCEHRVYCVCFGLWMCACSAGPYAGGGFVGANEPP